jgi:hypothetical protein
MSDYAELIDRLKLYGGDNAFYSWSLVHSALMDAAGAIESLRASLANEKEAREKADALATFFETEMTRILQEGQRK